MNGFSEVSHFHPWPNVTVVQDDGYSGLLRLTQADFVLIDPPDLKHPRRIIEVMKHLKRNNIAFMCWTPRIGNSKKPPSEGFEYTEFRNKVKSELQIKAILIQWDKNWRTKTCGCALHIWPEKHHNIAKQVTDELISIMGWSKVE